MKKTYSKPQLKTETFAPQEYCNPCTTTMTLDNTSHAYFDLNGDGNFDSGENTIPNDYNYKGIKVYYLQKAENQGAVNNNRWYDSTDSPTTPSGQSYTSGYFSTNGTKPFYRFRSGPTINIIEGRPYQNVS